MFGCSSDDSSKDSGTAADLAARLDTGTQQDGAHGADSTVKTDGTSKPADGPQPAWACTLEPGGGPFTNPHADGCRWDWTCPTEGNRQLYCETVSSKSLTCSCKNLTTGTTDKTFTSTDICTYSTQTIAAQANAHCGWKLP